MQKFDPSILKELYVPASSSHKGQNGKVLVIGGSHLFHSSAFWALEIASKIVDMVYFSSTPMNNEIVKKLKAKFINGIIVPREKLEDYIAEADSILIGPGLPRPDGEELGDDDTRVLTEKFLMKYPNIKWVVDGGSLQVISPEILPKTAIITPNKKEFKMLFGKDLNPENVELLSRKFEFTILAKGEKDYVCDSRSAIEITGGNAGLTKGGTGDVLAGLVASFYTKNNAVLSAAAASYINKKAGESLGERVGLYYNASDLVNEIPHVMRKLI
ncbi:MAG: NAD(P)H-hydrate dehydratase [Candidatus Levybacteria bacterium]|nr:NAD(P)H-hydrate dehydratase [Candidatus Levybacteria bacterium]